MAKDPVCGMTVDSSSNLKSVYEGRTYYFCSEECLGSFQESPERYAKGGSTGHGGHQGHAGGCGMGVGGGWLGIITHAAIMIMFLLILRYALG